MKLFHILFIILVALLAIILLAAVTPEVVGATGAPHPEFKGMFVSPANIDLEPHTRWLGYLFGLGIIALFGIMLFIGNRKGGKVTSIGKWLTIGLVLYILVYTLMVISHWSYAAENGGPFFLFMPAPTAWMIFGAWFVPLVITFAYVFKFEDAVISDEEIESFHQYLKEQKNTDTRGGI